MSGKIEHGKITGEARCMSFVIGYKDSKVDIIWEEITNLEMVVEKLQATRKKMLADETTDVGGVI